MARVTSHDVFFPAATVYAAVSVGLWVLVPGHEATPAWHAHELVFGYVVAVIAGFLMTHASRGELVACAAVWLAARIAWTVPGVPDLVRALASMISAGAIVLLANRGFLRSVKRGQNAVFPVLLAVLGLCDVAMQAAMLLAEPDIERSTGLVAVLLVVLLIVVMGGRIAGAALSGLAQRSGRVRIPPRPWLERTLVAAVVAVAVAVAIDLPFLLAAAAWVAAGGILVRLAGWSAGLGLAGADLLSLIAAHGFIALGLAGIGVGILHPPWPASVPLHFVTVGGIGIATVTMMLKTRAQRERLPLPAGAIAITTSLLGLSAAVRALGHGDPAVAYPVAGIAWIAAMALCLAALLRR